MCNYLLIIIAITSLMPNLTEAGEPVSYEPLSPRRAVNQSLLSTGIPVFTGGLLIIADPEGGAGGLGLIWGTLGLLIGPGIGHFYAHHPWGFWRGLLIRAGGAGAVITALAISWDEPDISGGWELFLGGCAIIIGSAIFDIWQAGKVAEDYNGKHRLARVKILPDYFPQSRSFGIRLSVGF